MRLKRAIKVVIGLWLLLAVFFGSYISCRAESNSFVTIASPVRGEYAWGQKPDGPLSGVILQNGWLKKSGLPATWLLQYDAVYSPAISSFFKSDKLVRGSEIGVFLEITPLSAEAAGVSYPSGGVFWHDANKIFLSGYKPEDRKKLIDAIFGKFKSTFGDYPKSVGAWHIDAYSARYMNERYGVTGILICADQFGTDGYQIWGGWWGIPYFPSKYNILVPAQSQKNKIDAVVFWWAGRDPDLGYGGSVVESTYSVQANDYIGHGLGIDYFRRLLDIYLYDKRNEFGQVTIGLENDSDWPRIGSQYEEQIAEIAKRTKEGKIKAVTMFDFASWYRQKYPKLSPSGFVGEWENTLRYRIRVKDKLGVKMIDDLRLYNDEWPEANLLTANPRGTLSLNNPYKIDTVRFGDSLKIVDFEINKDELAKRFGDQKIPFEENKLLLLFFYSLTLLLLSVLLRKNVSLLFIIIVGSVSLSLVVVKSGLVYPFGMGFWGPNGHDGIWHLALINQLSDYSLSNPIFSGATLTNYHFGFDLLAAIIHKITFIPVHTLYFQILPPVMAITLGLLVYRLVEKWTKSKFKAYWSVFFVYFGGSWGWVVSLLRTGKLGGESIFWANQAISSLINPPYVLSLLAFLLGAIKFLDYLKRPTRSNLFFCAILFGILFQIKVYAGIIVLGSLILLFLIELFYHRGDKKVRMLTAGVLVVSLLVFMPFNFRAPSLLVFSPFWFPHTMLSYGDRLGWIKLENARNAYFQSGNWIKWLLAEWLALVIFLLGNIGTRVVGFLGLWKKEKDKNFAMFNYFLLFGLLISFLLPLLFIQKGNPWNTIQFFYFFQFIASIFAGIALGRLWESKAKRALVYFASAVLVALTLPTSVTTLKNDYLPGRPPSRVSVEELEALSFLKKQPKGMVLTYPYNSDWKNKFSEPRPLYAYETTGYVSALSEKVTFLEDEMNLEIIGTKWKERRENMVRFFGTNNKDWAYIFLKDNKISYIYLVQGQKMNLGLGDINGEKIFENGETVIIHIN